MPLMTSLHDSPYSWFRLAVSILIATVGSVGIWAIVVIMPQVEAEFGVGRGDVSLPYTSTMLGFAIGNLLIGRAVDRFGIVAALTAAALVQAIGFAIAAAAPSIWALILVQFAIGLGAASTFGPMMADISHWFMRRRGVAVAIVACGNYLAGAVWPLLLAGTLETDGWRTVCAILAVGVAALMIPLALLIRRRPPEIAHEVAGTAAAANRLTAGFSPRTLQIMLFTAGVACCVAMSMPQVHIVAYCVDLGFGGRVGAEMLAVMLMGGAISRFTFGMIADRLGGVRTLLIGSGLQCLALFLYLPFDGLVSLYIVSAIFGLSQGGIVPCYAIMVREYMPPKEAGARVGVVIMGTVLGMALGGWMSGWIYDLTRSYELAFLNGIAWNVMNMAIILTIFLRRRPAALAPA